MQKNLPFHRRLVFALNGIAHAARSEKSFRTQLFAGAAAIGLLLWLGAEPIW
jgi:diacylglycerol kinase